MTPRSDERFPKVERLRRRWEFLAVQNRGKKLHLGRLLVFVRRGREGKRRVGFTVSKKVGNAAQRNQVKRWLREIWRRQKAIIPLGLDVVFVAKRNAAASSFQELNEQFLQLQRRLRREGDSPIGTESPS